MYIDGQAMASISNSPMGEEHWHSDVNKDMQIMAVECETNNGFADFIAYAGDVLISDGSWKCSETEEDNWYQMDFNDSEWKNAIKIERNYPETHIHYSHPNREHDGNYPESAWWMWSSRIHDIADASAIYCRGKTGKNITVNLFSLQKLPFTSVIREIFNQPNYATMLIMIMMIFLQQAVCGHNETYTEY